MKKLLVLLIVAGLALTLGQTTDKPGPMPRCDYACAFLFSPVCAVNSHGEKRNFEMMCGMVRLNCEDNEDFRAVGFGNCTHMKPMKDLFLY